MSDSEFFSCRVEPGTKDAIAQIAVELGYTWGDKPRIGSVVEAIARNKDAIAAVLKLEKRG